MTFLWLLGGAVLLVFGADVLVRGASRLARAAGVSSLVVGLTVVAFGTSAPEMAVSVSSSLGGKPDIALGNVLGSNIFNVLFILGISAVIVPLVVDVKLIRFDVPVMTAISLIVLLLGLDGRIGRIEGSLLFAGLIVYTGWCVVAGRRAGSRPAQDSPDDGDEPDATTASSPGKIIRHSLLVLIGLGLLVLGSRWFVEGASALARSLGASELLIGLTIVAAGTSLPEVATSIIAAIRGEREIAVGNVVGSNIFNLLGVLGLSAAVAPDGVGVAPQALDFDLPVMVAVAFACLPIFFTGHRIARWEGALFVLYYVAYTVALVLMATESTALPAFLEAMIWFVIPLTVLTLAVVTSRAIDRVRWRRAHERWSNARSTAHRVVVIGGGFGGLETVRRLAGAPLDVILVDRRNFHLFQPLLYQVATGALSPANVAAPLRGILRRQWNVTVRLSAVADIDVAARRVHLDGGGSLPYDTLVVAAGARHSYFGRPDWEATAPGLKTIEDATEIRRRVLGAFERAEHETDPAERAALLTFVVVGAGPTGVELAGALAETARHTLAIEFRKIDPSHARILLVEAGDRVLSAYPPRLSERALESLRRLRVVVRLGTRVTALEPGAVTIEHGGATETIPTRTVLWAAGVEASPLARRLGEQTGATIDRAGRIEVDTSLNLPGHPEIFVVGDMARCVDASGAPLPGTASVAVQQGRHVARAIRAALAGKDETRPPFAFRELGNLATIGRSAAVADFGRLRFSGLCAWILWLVVHLAKLSVFENRVLVLIQWAWSFFTFGRAARLMTGGQPPGDQRAEPPARK